MRHQTWGASPVLTSSVEFGTGTFNAEVSFHLDEGSHDAEEEPAGRRTGIGLAIEEPEPDPRVLKLVGERDQIFLRCAPTVEF